VSANRKVTTVTEPTTVYTVTTSVQDLKGDEFKVTVFPNPSSDFIAVQIMGLNKQNLSVELYDSVGKLVQKSAINAGATNTYLDTKSLYAGNYVIKIFGADVNASQNIMISK
jgi:hypothetical protein